jgi:hypothetical protein
MKLAGLFQLLADDHALDKEIAPHGSSSQKSSGPNHDWPDDHLRTDKMAPDPSE